MTVSDVNARPFLGEWTMDGMDGDDELRLDMCGAMPVLRFDAKGRGVIRFFNVEGTVVKSRFSRRDGGPYAEFTWKGRTPEEGTLTGTGWARLEQDEDGEDELVGEVRFDAGPQLAFEASRW
ncbi:hypothetical protein ACFL59_03465 [Planctomycetota bacterium]